VDPTLATFLAFLAAPVVPAITLATSVARDFGSPQMLKLFFPFYGLSMLVTLAVGVPAYFILARVISIRYWSATTVGLLIGALVATLFRIPKAPGLEDYLVMGPIGAISGFVFWLVWRMGQRNQAPSPIRSH
jgi:hypothetical protein